MINLFYNWQFQSPNIADNYHCYCWRNGHTISIPGFWKFPITNKNNIRNLKDVQMPSDLQHTHKKEKVFNHFCEQQSYENMKNVIHVGFLCHFWHLFKVRNLGFSDRSHISQIKKCFQLSQPNHNLDLIQL